MANYEKTGTFTHVDESGNTYELYPQTKAEMVEGLSLFGPVTTAGTGAAYTATVNGITELKVGVKLTIIPHTVSTSLTPTLNVNNLGAKYIRMPGTYNTGTAANAPVASWLVANKPVTVTWDGTQWETDIARPTASSISGTVAIENGGTGANTLEGAKEALGINEINSNLSGLFKYHSSISLDSYSDGATIAPPCTGFCILHYRTSDAGFSYVHIVDSSTSAAVIMAEFVGMSGAENTVMGVCSKGTNLTLTGKINMTGTLRFYGF